ncbi:hypothetical protein IJT10_05395, partial [bacterium]|nr:hypothetical protein [bacterium]
MTANNNTWLEQRLENACQSGIKTFVVAGAPGVGKSFFLKKIAQKHNSIFIEIRHAMETDTLRGFWKAILTSAGIDNSKIGDTPYSWSAAFCEFLKNRESKDNYFIIVDALGRAPELVDNAGIAGLDNLPEGVFVLIGTRPGRHLDVLESSGAKVEWVSPSVKEHLHLLKEWISSNIKDPSGEITEGLLKYSEGNFFIAKHLIEAINKSEISIHEIGKSIPALEAALSVLWEDQYEQTPFEVRDDLVAIACLIAESGEPLNCSS